MELIKWMLEMSLLVAPIRDPFRVPAPELQTAVRHAETLLKIEQFFAGVKLTPVETWEEEEAEFCSFLTTRVDAPCPEIEQAMDRVLSFLQMKKAASLVSDLVAYSQRFVDFQKAGVHLIPQEERLLKDELATLKERACGLEWSGKERALSQIGKLERALPTLASKPVCNPIRRFFTRLFASKQSAPAGALPVGIPNEGNSCFLASALQLILKNPVLEEALIEEWTEGGPSREFGEFLFNYREAQKSGQTTVSGIGKLRNALCRLSGSNEFATGQWDANEVFRTLIADEKSPLFKRLQEKGYLLTESVRRYYAPPEGALPRPGGDLVLDAELNRYYSENKSIRPAQLEVELTEADAGKPLGALIGAIWTTSLEGSEPACYQMQDLETHPCNPLFQKTAWSNPAPTQAMVSLKRWAYAGSGVKVNAPISVKEVEEIQIGDAKVSMKLIGFTLHSGSTNGGHWVSYSADNGAYFCNNDSRITRISREEFLARAQGASDLLFAK